MRIDEELMEIWPNEVCDTSSCFPVLFPLLGTSASSFLFSFLFSSIKNTLYICALSLCIYNICFSTPLVLSLASLTPLHTSSLYLLEFWIYFEELVFPFFSPFSCNVELSVWTPRTSSTLFFVFLLTLPLVKWGHTFVWASCSWCYGIVIETLWRYLRGMDVMLNPANYCYIC